MRGVEKVRSGGLRVALAGVWMAVLACGASAADGSHRPSSTDIPNHMYEHAQTLVALPDGRHLNLFCMGTGTPVVIFEAGGGDDSLSFQGVQGRLAATTRVCSYDRAGMGFSDPSDAPSTSAHAVSDLHALIRSANLPLPVVLAGHSDGGLYVSLYAAEYPDDVAGLVLIDPNSPGLDRAATQVLDQPWLDQWRRMEGDDLKEARRCLDLAGVGALTSTPSRHAQCLDDPPNKDPALHHVLNMQMARASEQEAIYTEDADTSPIPHGGLSDAELAFQQAHLDLGDKPILVLSGTNEQGGLPPKERKKVVKAMLANQGALASHSRQGRQILVDSDTEYLQTSHPEIVVHAVIDVVQEARKQAPSP